MNLMLQFILASLGTIGFAIVSSTPKESLIKTGIIGGAGWAIYVYLTRQNAPLFFSYFLSAAFLSLAGEIAARIFHNPATVFIIPAIIPLVPGYSLYLSMLEFMSGSYDKGIQKGVETLFGAAAIAVGIILASSIARIFYQQYNKYKIRIQNAKKV